MLPPFQAGISSSAGTWSRLRLSATARCATRPAVHVQTGEQMRILAQRRGPALPGDGQHERQRRVVERERCGAGNRARHVGHSVMRHAVEREGRLSMSRRPVGLEAAVLVNRNVDQHSAGASRWSGRVGPVAQLLSSGTSRGVRALSIQPWSDACTDAPGSVGVTEHPAPCILTAMHTGRPIFKKTLWPSYSVNAVPR